MRGLLITVLVVGLLAGCRIAGPGGDATAPAGNVITEQTLPPQAEAPLSEVQPEPEPAFLAEQRRLCERGGGQLSARGRGVVACVRRTSDDGQRCQAAADCEGLCLARSGSCAPISPLFGCQEVFTARGLRETLCTE